MAINPSEIFNNGNPYQKMGQFKLFINMIQDHISKKYTGLAFWVIPALIFTILYVISPFDMDWIPLVGWIDDAAVVAIFYKFIGKEIQKYETWRKSNTTL